jgi:hypothetical protein
MEEAQFTKIPTGTWNKLVDIAHDNLMPGEPHSEQHAAALAVWEEASALRLEAFEKARYHGLGIIGCNFMRKVMTPDGRTDFIQSAASVLAQDHSYRYGHLGKGGLLFNEIWERGEHYVTAWPENSGYEEIPLEERIVTNTLIVSAHHDVTDPPRELVARVLADDAAKTTIEMGSLGVASFVLQLAINLHYKQQTGQSVSLASRPRLKDIADADTITSFNTTKISRVMARLHVEELCPASKFVTLNADRTLQIDQTKIPEQFLSEEHMLLSRGRDAKPIRRIGCPMRHMPGALAFASEVVGPVINEAQRELLA